MYTDLEHIDNSDADLSSFVVNDSEIMYVDRSCEEEAFEIIDISRRREAIYDSTDE
jgi:hypothetical protein